MIPLLLFLAGGLAFEGIEEMYDNDPWSAMLAAIGSVISLLASLAIALARKARYSTNPYPMLGAVPSPVLLVLSVGWLTLASSPFVSNGQSIAALLAAPRYDGIVTATQPGTGGDFTVKVELTTVGNCLVSVGGTWVGPSCEGSTGTVEIPGFDSNVEYEIGVPVSVVFDPRNNVGRVVQDGWLTGAGFEQSTRWFVGLLTLGGLYQSIGAIRWRKKRRQTDVVRRSLTSGWSTPITYNRWGKPFIRAAGTGGPASEERVEPSHR